MKCLNPKYYLFFFLLFISCSEEVPNSSTSAKLPKIKTQETTLLLFKHEEKVEVWTFDSPRQFIRSFQQKSDVKDISIGQFSITEAFSKNWIPESELDHLKEVIVFPSDSRSSGIFKPCFACPHTVAETYVSLELLLKSFPLSK